MGNESISTAPKPFIFVLMPFKPEFDDIYKFGIKGAAEDVGAYSERVDEQNYIESMLDRIYNQINKADVIVADMTGQNPNVFYEVGYAHALGKIVLLLTQDSNDIPFDLKHRPHILYSGQIATLRNKLAPKLKWAINESHTRGKAASQQTFEVIVRDKYVPDTTILEGVPVIELFAPKEDLNKLSLNVFIQNVSPDTTYPVTHIYLFTSEDSRVRPQKCQRFGMGGAGYQVIWTDIEPLKSIPRAESDALPVRYRLDMELPRIPTGAVEEHTIRLQYIPENEIKLDKVLTELRTNAPQKEELLILRIHTYDSVQEFPFKLKVTILMTTPAR